MTPVKGRKVIRYWLARCDGHAEPEVELLGIHSGRSLISEAICWILPRKEDKIFDLRIED